MRVFKKMQDAFDLNESTLSGCVDIVVAEQADSSLKSSSFHVRFGKFKVLQSNEKIVTIKINDLEQQVHMKMDSTGKAYFEEIREEGTLDKLINSGLSSDDAFSDYDLQHFQSDDEGAFDKNKLDSHLKKNTYRFDDLISPQKDTKDNSKNQKDKEVSKEASQKQEKEIPKEEKKEEKKGFGWFNLFGGGKKKPEGTTANQMSRKNSETLSVDDLTKVVIEQSNQSEVGTASAIVVPAVGQEKQPALVSNTSNNASNTNPSSELGAQQQANSTENDPRQGQNPQMVKQQVQDNQVIGASSAATVQATENEEKQKQKQNSQEVNKSTTPMKNQQSEEDKGIPAKSEETNEVLAQQQLQVSQQSTGQTNSSLGNKEDLEKEKGKQQVSQLPLQQQQLTKETSSSNRELKRQPSKDSIKDNYKVEMKDLIDSKKDLKELIAAKKRETSCKSPERQLTLNSAQQSQIHQDEKVNDEDAEEEEEEEEENTMEIGLSLCNNVPQKKGQEKSLEVLFQEHIVTFEQFSQDPLKILNDKNLLLKIGFHLYPWEIAASILVSRLAFGNELPEPIMHSLIKQQKKKQSSGFLDFLFRRNKPEEEQKNPLKKSSSSAAIPKKEVSVVLPENEQIVSPIMSPKSDEASHITNNPNTSTTQASQGTTGEPHRKNSDDMSVKSETSSVAGGQKRIKKVFRPKSDVLKSFNLKQGGNKISFTVKTSLLGEQTLEGYIFLWPSDTQIVISDIDGTITKSDMLGQIMPLLDKDWTHEGVIKLFQDIYKNGYKILYLTARAIGQSDQTRNFIYNVKQDGLNLPLGPVVMSSDRLFESFKREVIDRKPEVFKIAVLREIQGLFHDSQQVFYAGFGNRETDCLSYRAVQVGVEKIYITNPAGELHQINTTDKTTYTSLNAQINVIFPPLRDIESQGIADKIGEVVEQQKNNEKGSLDQEAASVGDIESQDKGEKKENEGAEINLSANSLEKTQDQQQGENNNPIDLSSAVEPTEQISQTNAL